MMRPRLLLVLSLGMAAIAPVTRAQDAPAPPVEESAEDLGLEDAAAPPPASAQAADAPAADGSIGAERDPSAADPAPADPSLRPVLAQFGGREGLVALMDEFMERLLADPRTRSFFAEADQAAVKRHLVEQFCVILGGDCTYTGRDMKTAHAGMGVDRAAFNALVENLQRAMDARRIPFRAQNRLLARLAPMHREIEGPAAP
jgi:hemoglobin